MKLAKQPLNYYDDENDFLRSCVHLKVKASLSSYHFY